MNRRIFWAMIQTHKSYARRTASEFIFSLNHDSVRNIATTSSLRKVRPQKKNAPAANLSDDKIMSDANREFTELQNRLVEEFNRHFSMRTDLRVYEECKVTLENAEVHRMNELGRVTMRNPQTIAINFDDFPSAIKAARLALQNSAICVNPQQEGTTIYVPVPDQSRELREKTAEKARFILNDYKKALNTTFCKYSDKNDNQENKIDDQHRRRKTLLALKRQFEVYADRLLKEKREALMKEIA